ncbi:DUF4832 domain-containing protein [Thermus sp.]|uniref:DUF4832 domain-containing protein n=1 Tax=Thermus sp. TaxID=275 RepID=UPI00263685EA|nr:DUF4832 domain-containing protein [Thermus sp.]MCX7850851.1 DUF4832 domain-containing protein [Thermus sp.]
MKRLGLWLFLAALPGLLGGCREGGPSFPPPYAARPDGVYKGGALLPLYGLNWFGLETCDRAPHGLWAGRSVGEFLAQVRGLGFNALRLPVSPEVLRDQGQVAPWARTGDPGYPQSPLAGLRYVLERAQGLGFHVLLDLHTFRCDLIGGNLPGRPFDPARGYTKGDWHADLRRLARLSLEFPNVFAIDLFNEPHGLTWSEWKALVQEAAQEVLKENPRILVAVEGVGNLSDHGGYPAFWGGNLKEATDDLGLGDRLLYLPHVYGPSVHAMPYFSHPSFPENLPPIWDLHFGHLSGRGLPWGVGEFGGRYTGQDQVWQDRFALYLWQKGVKVWFYWALNPNSGDTGGILQDDWRTPVEGKVNLLKGLMGAPSGQAFDFLPEGGEVPGPERGFSVDSYYPNTPLLDAPGLVAQWRAQGFEVRLIRRVYYLHAFAGQDTLPQAFLHTLAQDLASAEAAGVKLILRFAYRPDENRAGGPTYCDPPKARVLGHIAQLGPVLRSRIGVIAYLEAGFIGPWGEWHSASPEAALMDPLPGYQEGAQPPCGRQNYDRKLPNAATLEIVQALLGEVPGRKVALRYPMAKAKLVELAQGGVAGTYPSPSSFTPLTPQEAHRNTLKARLGAHNDCFLASADDYGTYYYTPGPQQEREKEYWSQDNRFTVMGGETCTPAPHVPSGEDPARYVYEQFRRYRYNNLNLLYHPDMMAWFRSQPFGTGTLLEALKRDLGYRLYLRRVEVSGVYLSPNQAFTVRLYLENQGFGGLYNPKGLELVFIREGDGLRVARTLEATGFYGPPPGEEGVYAYTVPAPGQPGTYALWLRIYDPDLPNNPAYSVPLASRLERREGRNALGFVVEVR